MRRSLLAILSTGLVLSLLAVFAAQWSMLHGAVEHGLREFVAGELAQDAEELFGSLVPPNGDHASLAVSHFDPAFLSPRSGHYYQVVVDGAVALRSPSLVYASLPVVALPTGQRIVRDVDTGTEHLLMSVSGYELRGRPVSIAVTTDLAPIAAAVDRSLARYTEVSAVLFALLVVVQIVIVRRGLRPVRHAAAEVGALERGEVPQLGEKVPAEVLPLVQEVNRLIALLAARLQRSREALGNVAHSLKGPLTLLAQLVDDDHLRQRPALRAQMTAQLEVLRARIDSELRRARVAGRPMSGHAVGLAPELEALADVMQKLHRQRNLLIECRVDPAAAVRADREDVVELCGNLLDNACKWARSQVRVTVTGNGAVTLAVEDDGPGCSPDDLAAIARRGVRLDEAAEGHGLGLSIVQGIAACYGATLQFGRSPALGGFLATVTFPAHGASERHAVSAAEI